ncbi:MAG: hypothetical protein N3F09_10665 [Bacteroidia bacterium]|nr:hypothetical protein [Bacteroidia bacterium]
MKNIILITMVVLSTIPMYFCQSKRKAQKNNDLAKVNEKESTKAKISFASYGSGIDVDTYGKLKEYLNKNNIMYSEKPMGREGEVDVSIDLSTKSADERKKIVQYLKSLHNPEKLVRVEVD